MVNWQSDVTLCEYNHHVTTPVRGSRDQWEYFLSYVFHRISVSDGQSVVTLLYSLTPVPPFTNMD